MQSIKVFVIFYFFVTTPLLAQENPHVNASHFYCQEVGQRKFKPAYLKLASDGVSFYDYGKTAKGLLGQNAMTSREECDSAVAASSSAFGVICSRTGLNGWKPTLYTGTRPGRADFGYLGGSSIMKFSDCLAATRSAGIKGVCFWGGSDWYISAIDREKTLRGPFRTIAQCTEQTRP